MNNSNNNKHIKQVIRKIILDNLLIVAIDHKVKGFNDDKIYQQNKKLWEELPRCFATIVYGGKIIRTICGLRKFGECDQYKVQLTPQEKPTRTMYLEKLNGEYCSISSFKIVAETTFFVVRSKNVSLIFREENAFNDIESDNYQEDRYGYVRVMAKKFWFLFQKMSNINKMKLIAKTLIHTINCESISPNHQHLVNYNDKSLLFPFALTRNQSSDKGLTSIIPKTALDWFREIGFGSRVLHRCVNSDEKEMDKEVKNNFFTKKNSEGCVVYNIVLDITTGVERVVQIYKHKNAEYVFWRGLREKMRSQSTIAQTKHRLSNFHCKIPDQENLIKEAIKFYAFCWDIVGFNENWSKVFDQWASHFKYFNALVIQQKYIHYNKFIAYDKTRTKQIIATIGLPGCGKTTLTKALRLLIPASQRVNQDECGRSVKQYCKAIEKHLRDEDVKWIILDKCNHNVRIRSNTYKLLNMHKINYLDFKHPFDDAVSTQSVALCMARINQRGKGHPNLFPSKKLPKVIHGFQKSYKPLTPKEIEQARRVIDVNMTMSQVDMVKYVLTKLKIPFENQRVLEVIDEVYKMEKELATFNSKPKSKKTLYWRAFVKDISQVFDHDEIKHILSLHDKFKNKDELHCTMVFPKSMSDVKFEEECVPFLDKEVDIKIVSIAHDDKAIALVCEVDFPCRNEHPHLTLALGNHVNGVYSNTLIKHGVIELEKPLIVKAVVQRLMRK